MLSLLLLLHFVSKFLSSVLEVVNLRVLACYIRDFALESQNYTWLWPGIKNSTRGFVNEG
jgi:hypothetical protein